jgi:hypothetical protein
MSYQMVRINDPRKNKRRFNEFPRQQAIGVGALRFGSFLVLKLRTDF